LKTSLFVMLLLAGTSAVAADSCESLAKLALPNTTITRAETVAAGAFTPPKPFGFPAPGFKDLPAFCRVATEIKPTPDSDIKMEVWMPLTGWNGKFQGVGNGGWSGEIWYPFIGAALANGYAAASTDTGHEGDNAQFALDHPEKLIDFGYRAVHEMTVKAKAIVAAFYGNSPSHSYWSGCSSGGKQGLKAAQQFPLDYDGISAGAPANYWTHLMAAGVWAAQAQRADPAGFIPPEKAPLLHRSVLEACDALDGMKDGLIDDPTRCHFDPTVLQCKAGDGPDCLTAAQVATAKKIYAGPKNPRTGVQILPGWEYGGEVEWIRFNSGEPAPITASHFKYVVFKDPQWDFRKLNFDSDVALTDRLDKGTINATDPNLKAFFDHGGKLLLYHGWNDGLIPPDNTINYYKSVLAAMGADKVKNSVRLFMVPGMNHCFGGDGPDGFDRMKPVADWVEKGQPPDRIVAAHVKAGAVDRTRPLCPYPQVAKYKGTGSVSDAANFTCSAAEATKP
jgi:feruloyl esterase